jgi:hypothetical protein
MTVTEPRPRAVESAPSLREARRALTALFEAPTNEAMEIAT